MVAEEHLAVAEAGKAVAFYRYDLAGGGQEAYTGSADNVKAAVRAVQLDEAFEVDNEN